MTSERTDCNFCGRKNTPGKGGWCVTCFSLWYDGGPQFTDPINLKRVSLLNPEGCYSPSTDGATKLCPHCGGTGRVDLQEQKPITK